MNMRRGIRLVLLLCLLPSLACASSPFGITLGMTVEEMESAWMHPERIYEGEGFYWVDPPYPTPFFTQYAVKVDQGYGVYIVQAYSDEILCDSSGSQIKEAYLQLEEEMNAQFGRGSAIGTSRWTLSSFLKPCLMEPGISIQSTMRISAIISRTISSMPP